MADHVGPPPPVNAQVSDAKIPVLRLSPGGGPESSRAHGEPSGGELYVADLGIHFSLVCDSLLFVGKRIEIRILFAACEPTTSAYADECTSAGSSVFLVRPGWRCLARKCYPRSWGQTDLPVVGVGVIGRGLAGQR